MKNKILVLFLIILSIGVLGCQQNEKIEESNIEKNLPKEMPSDFDFSIQFGVNKKNEINTFDGTVTKDLIADGTATTKLTLTEEEMKDIYSKMMDINIAETKEFIPKPKNGTICMQEPHEDDNWKILVNGETITHLISGQYCNPTNDAIQLINLRNYIFSIIRSKDEYQLLPDSVGGYE